MPHDLSGADRTVKVWDPLVRIFHWSLVVFFFVAYITEDEWETLHVYAGYTVAALVLFRLVWGVIGTRYARFTNFVKGPRVAWTYLRQTLTGRAPRYIGHNPAAAAMIVALLFCLLITALSGMIHLAGEGGGPLAGTFLANLPEHEVEEFHELFANGMLLLIVLHVTGVVISSLGHHENLVRAMINGRKRQADDDQDSLHATANGSEVTP
ncbi:MAG: cytochrome b/b6 domain-containing protein [Pseudomonadales bacterium]|nr:cytochrome b/b6 domain-containing protein [Pseudomonadales bacterium]